MGQPGRDLERHKGGMVDDWGQSAPGKTTTLPTFGWKKCGDLSEIYESPAYPECCDGSDRVRATILDECPWNYLQGLGY